jgi:hypothetical protein
MYIMIVVFCFLTSGIRLKAHTIIITPLINISVNYWIFRGNKKSLKIQKEYLETVNRKRTDNTNIKSTKGQTNINKPLYIQLRIAFIFCIIIAKHIFVCFCLCLWFCLCFDDFSISFRSCSGSVDFFFLPFMTCIYIFLYCHFILWF